MSYSDSEVSLLHAEYVWCFRFAKYAQIKGELRAELSTMYDLSEEYLSFEKSHSLCCWMSEKNASVTKHQENYIFVFCLTWDGAKDFNIFWGIVDDNTFGSSGYVCHLALVQINLLSIPAITASQDFFSYLYYTRNHILNHELIICIFFSVFCQWESNGALHDYFSWKYGMVRVGDPNDCLVSIFNKTIKFWTRFSTPMFGDFCFSLSKQNNINVKNNINIKKISRMGNRKFHSIYPVVELKGKLLFLHRV